MFPLSQGHETQRLFLNNLSKHAQKNWVRFGYFKGVKKKKIPFKGFGVKMTPIEN